MHIFFASSILFILALFSEHSSAGPTQADQYDCHLVGEGRVYFKNPSTSRFEEYQTMRFKLEAKRKLIGTGLYLFVETKTYSDGRPQETTHFQQSLATGPYYFRDETLESSGVCTRQGHCIGTLTIAQPPFVGKFATDFDANGIRTVTHSSSQDFFVDEILTPVAGTTCPLADPTR